MDPNSNNKNKLSNTGGGDSSRHHFYKPTRASTVELTGFQASASAPFAVSNSNMAPPPIHTNGTMSTDGQISPMELESLAANGDYGSSENNNKNASLDRLAASSLPSHPLDKLMLLLKLYFELYPKLMVGGSTLLVGLLLYAWSPWQNWGHAPKRNYMTHDYTNMQENFNFQTAQIDHWCLFGGDDRCYCEDPTEGMSRSEVPGWSAAHVRNKHLATQAVGRQVDVVFVGDQTIQSWDGRWLDRPAPEGVRINKLFNQTFVGSADADFQAVALGIYGDRINNILWRIQHGELPNSLNPKVFWLVMGTNDLALSMCSEEVVTLGIMRIAEEIHHMFPDAIVVIQGILPRSNHKDGSLEGKKSSRQERGKQHTALFRPSSGHGSFRSTGGADPAQYMPMSPGGRQLEQQLEEEALPDDILQQELDQYAPRQLQDLTTPGIAKPTTTSTEPASSSHATTPSTSVKPGTTLATRPIASSEAVRPSSSKTNPNAIQWDSKGNVIAGKATEHRAPQPHYDFYLWPSIQAINKELEGFCSKHEHFVYFDADDLVLGSIGNAHYRAAHKTIITELMPNYVHLSALGHQVVMGALNDELKRIIFDDDETNDIETKDGNGRQ